MAEISGNFDPELQLTMISPGSTQITLRGDWSINPELLLTMISPSSTQITPTQQIKLNKIYSKGTCNTCYNDSDKVTKCSNCIYIVCKDCVNNWHIKNNHKKCMHCFGLLTRIYRKFIL